MLLCTFFPVDLASHSSALTHYETSSTNHFCLASYDGLDSLACQALDAFHIQPRQTLHFWFVRRNWTFSRFFNREMIYHWSITTYYDELPQLLHILLEYKIQLTMYLLSRGLLSRISRSVCKSTREKPTNHLYCIQALRSDPSNLYTTLSHTS